MVRAAPARERIAVDVEQRIDAGELGPGEPIESEAAIGERFGVARGTVRAALAELADRGRIESVPGKGWFVRDPDAESSTQQGADSVITELRRELESGRYRPGDSFLSEKDVSDRYGLTRYGAKNVLGALESAGLLKAVHGKGRFVTRRP